MKLKTFIVEYHDNTLNINDKMELEAPDLTSAKNILKVTLDKNYNVIKVYEKLK